MSAPSSRSRSPRSFGSLRRLPSGRWQARYPDPSGAYRSAPHTFDTKRAAADWLAATRADMLRGQWRDPSAGSVAFGKYAADWLATRVDLAPSTRELYRYQLARWVDADLLDPTGGTVRLGTTALDRLDVSVIRRWFAAVTLTARQSASTTGPRRTHPARTWAASVGVAVKPTGRLSPDVLAAWKRAGAPAATAGPARGTGETQAAQAYRIVRTICNAAIADNLLNDNPCRLVRAGSSRATERIPATPAEIEALAAAMPLHLAAAVHVAAWSGLRAGELFALDRSRVDLAAGTVRVDRALSVLRGAVTGFGPPKTESSRRTVHLPPHVVSILGEHMATHTSDGPTALVFARPDTGEPITPAARSRAFSKARKAIGRTELRWHDLRHTGATLAAQTGASVRELQHRLGHSTVAAAMIYQHATADRDRDLAARLSSLAAPRPDAETCVISS